MLKKVLFLCLTVFPLEALAQTEDGQPEESCENKRAELEALGIFRSLEDAPLDTPLLYSPLGRLCEGELAAVIGDWENALKSDVNNRWSKTLQRLNKERELGCYLKHAGGSSEIKTLPQEAISERVTEYLDLIYQCEALIAISGHSDFSDQDVRSKSSQEVRSITQGLDNCTNHPNPAQCMAIQQGQQGILGAQLSCRHHGVETQDYSACKKIVRTIDGFFIAKQANKNIQQLRATDLQQEEQMKLQQKARSGAGVSNKDALGAQKSGIAQQSKLAYERAALDGAQLATITAMYNSMPDKESLYDECKKAQVFENVNQLVSRYSLDIPQLYDSSDKVCHKVISQYAGHALLLNQEAKDGIKLVLAKSALGAVENVAKGKLLAKQADRVQDAIDGIQEREKPDFQQHFANPETFKRCDVDPSSDGCPRGGEASTKTHDAIQTQFSFGAAEGNASSGQLNQDSTGGDNSVTGNPRNRKVLPNRIGQVAGSGGGGGGGFVDTPPPPGRMKRSSAGGGGGGGGGGGAGGASLARDGGGPSGGGGAQGGGSAGNKDVKLKFSGSGGGSLKLAGGGFQQGKKPKSSANPFDKLFGKKKGKKKNGNDVLDFKKIGTKEKSIFTMLSSRYGAVVKNKRLLKYEIRL